MIRFACYAFAAVSCVASFANADVINAEYAQPTDRYDHGVLGDAIEYGALVLSINNCSECTTPQLEKVFVLPLNRVFEDIAPRLADIDKDGDNEVIVVETDIEKGAQLAIYDETGKIAETPFIGQKHRWLAPVGVGDFDRDGRMDVAYVETPHLGKILKIWSWDRGRLVQTYEVEGITNHRIGDNYIVSGVRTCLGVPEIVAINGEWSHVAVINLTLGEPEILLKERTTATGAFRSAMACR